MFSSFRVYFVVVLIVLIFGVPGIAKNYPDQVQGFAATIQGVAGDLILQTASVILHNPRTIAELQAKYSASSSVMDKSAGSNGNNLLATNQSAMLPVTPTKVRILLVPGHEPGFGGTEFGSLKERTMNTELASDLYDILKKDPHFEVFKTRNNEVWDPVFAAYFKDKWSAIKEWQKDSHEEMRHLIAIGSSTQPVSTVFHNTAPTSVALRLYGITKWANENLVDVVIHIHFNDYPDHRDGVAGVHTGFSIYVPVGQYGNSTTTKAIAHTVFKRLSKDNSVSNLPGESSGIVDEPELIAIGANNTADAASMLIEYGYIYEPQFRTAVKRSAALEKLALDTYLGLQDFFTSNIGVTPRDL